jgi:AcrR family transcriptional regulator
VARADLPLSTPKSRRRREELLVAARETFERLGYFETRVADIAETAKVAHGTFYNYFDSKDHVLRELVDVLADDLFTASAAGIRRHRTPMATLRATIRSLLHAYRDGAGMIRILEQATASSDEFLRIRLEIRERFGQRLEAELRKHLVTSPTPVRRLDPTAAAYALGGMVEDFARGRYVLGVLVDEKQAIDTLTLIWARAIGLPEASSS